MKKWIARWFGRSDSNASVPAGAQSPPAPAPPAAVSGEQHYAEVGAAYQRWLTGPAADASATPAENLLLDELARLVRAPAAAGELVPRVPAVIPQLLRSLRDEGMSGAELSRQVGQDVVLVAEVIREANSPYYRPAAPVRTIEGAVMLLGQNGLRMLIARVAFRPIISTQAGRFAKLVAPRIWSQSEKCALAASLLAPGAGANPFEAYLAGLMQNVGLIVALRLADQVCQDGALPDTDTFRAGLLCSARALSAGIAGEWDFPPAVAAAIAQAGLLCSARALSAGIAGEWDFPPAVAAAIAQAGQPGAGALAQALAAGDLLAKLRLLVDAGEYDADDPFVLHGLDAARVKVFDKLRSEDD